MIDFLVVRKTDIVKDVTVISCEEFVRQYRMVIDRLVIIIMFIIY